jgi:hypothetical protein
MPKVNTTTKLNQNLERTLSKEKGAAKPPTARSRSGGSVRRTNRRGN